jgi:membrane protein DedA with SNARE-associated domain
LPVLALLLQPDLPGYLTGGWAYPLLGATSIVTEELAPILGGIAAAQGELGLKRVVIAITLGSWGATTLLYLLGWWRGIWMRRRWPKIGRSMKGALRAVRRRPWRSSLAVRFAFGARILLPLACGTARVRPDIYLIGTLISSVVWTSLFTAIGWLFGETAIRVLGRVRQHDLVASTILIGIAAFIALWVRRRQRDKLAEAESAEQRQDETP